MSNHRVVVTGLGIVAPNAHGLPAYEKALRDGVSGIRFVDRLRALAFQCQIGGIPQDLETLKERYFKPDDLLAMNHNMLYGAIAALDAWSDAGMAPPDENERDRHTGAFIGTGIGGADTFGGTAVPMIDAGKTRRLGSTMPEQIMTSNVSAKIAGILGLGNQVTTNSSACATGTESIVMAAERIRAGLAKRMLAGGSEGSSHYIWGGFDAMRVLDKNHNDSPHLAPRPMSRTAAGFVPGSGAGLLLLESLASAEERGVRIYAEVLGGAVNCGGHRGGGSMSAPNPQGVQDCIRQAVHAAGISPRDIDAVNGHLTGTFADPHEIANWSTALERGPDDFPFINSTKSLIGHGLGAAGGMESVAAVLQLAHGFVHGSLNCEDLHEKLVPYARSIPHRTVEPAKLDIIAKAGFGFGDVNACVIFKKWD